MPDPHPNDRRLTPTGQETPLRAAPPLPAPPSLPAAPERRLGPAPTLPVQGGSTATGNGPERPLAPAPLPARPASAGRQLPAAPAVPGAAPVRPGLQETPLPAVTGRPIGTRPEVPLARPVEVRGAVPIPFAPAPAAGFAPAIGIPPAPCPMALYGGAATAGPEPAGTAAQPCSPSQSTPPDSPVWFQPPATPPPVPPPGVGSKPPAPPASRPVDWTPHGRSGPVGSKVAAALSGNVLPAAKTSTAKSLRRESRARSSMLAVTFLLVAATFLIGMVIVFLLSLGR